MQTTHLEAQSGSFDRFLKLHANRFLYGDASKRAAWINFCIGFGLVGLAATLIVTGISSGETGVAFGASGPLAGGLANFVVGFIMRSRGDRERPALVRLDDETTAFLASVVRRVYGWRGMLFGARRYRRGLGGRMRRARWATEDIEPDKSAREVVHPEAMRLLEESSFHYNKLMGVLSNVSTDGSSALGRLRPTLYQAADETMARLLRAAASVDQYPESAKALIEGAEPRVKLLAEAATRAETLASQPNLAQSLAPSTTMDKALEELRLQQLVEDELASPTAQNAEESNELRA